MATAKQFELMFQLTAKLGPNFSQSFKNASKTMNALQSDLRNADQKLKDVSAYQKQQQAIAKSKTRVSELQAEHERLTREIEQTGQATPELTRQLQANEKALQKAQDATAREEEKLQELSDTLREAGVNTDNLGRDTDKLRQQYERLEQSQKKVQEITEKQAANKQAISQTKAQLGGLIGTVTALGIAIYAGPVKNAKEFQTAMAKVGTIANTDLVPMAKLRQEIINLSNETGKSANDLAEDVYNAISAGQSTADAVGFVENATKLATAGYAESGQALDVLSTILNAYGMEASKVTDVSDMLIQIQNKGKTTVAELSSSMGKIIPTANANNVALEQLGAGYATLTSKGIATAEATTYMNGMLNELGKSGSQTDKILRSKTGKSFSELMKSGYSLADVLQIVQEDAESSGKSLSDMFSSSEAGKAALSLMSDGVDTFNASVQGMLDSCGATEQAYAKMMDTTETKVAKAKNSIKNLGTVLGDMLLPYVGQVADKVAELATKFSEFAQENPQVIATVAKVAAGLVGLKAGGLVAKLGFLQVKGGILSVQEAFTMIKDLGMNNYLSSLTGGFLNFKNIGNGILGYFTNIKNAAGGVNNALGDVLNKSTLFTKIGGFFNSIGGRVGGMVTSAGSKVLNLFLSPFSRMGGRLGGIMSGIGTIIANSPLGKIGKIIGAGFGKITKFIAPVGNAIKTMLGPLGNLASSVFGPLGGVVGKILPIVGVITTIITVIQLVKNHLQEIRAFIEKTFGSEALAIFDKIVAVITNIGDTIKNIFSDSNIGEARNKIQEIFGDKGVQVFDTLVNILGKVKTAVSDVIAFVTTYVVPVAEQVLQVIINDVVPGIISFIQAAAPTIMSIIQSIVDFVGAVIPIIANFIAGLIPIISELISFLQTYVLPIISELFTFITSTVLPAISAAIQAILPVVTNVLSVLLPAIQSALTTIWNIVAPIVQGILQVVQAVMPVILSVVQSVIGSVQGIIQNLMTVLGGIIDFVTGVFTGNWSQAWEGIKSIFSGAVGGLGEIIKAPLQAVVSAVNTVIGGLNKLKVPDWVPGIGGMGINIPEIPGFAKGTNRTPSTFIAGENGPELITDAANRKVFTAAQTGQIFNNMAGAANLNTANNVKATAGAAGTIMIHVTNSPNVTVTGGGDTSGIKEQLQQYDEEFLEKLRDIIRAILKEQKEQEGRVAYA